MVETKYKVWSVFMFVFSGFYMLLTLLMMIGLFVSLAAIGSYHRYFSFAGIGRVETEVFIIVFVVLILLAAFFAFMNLHGGIILRRSQIRGKGAYICYGIICILGAINYGCSFFIYLIAGMREPRLVLSAMVSLFILIGCIITTVMMFSKISAGSGQQAGYRAVQAQINPMAGSSGCVRFLSGEYAGNDINMLAGQRMILGSDAAQANLVLQNDKVSPYHCMLEFIGYNGTYQITDYSVSGTFVNGMRLNTGISYTAEPQSIVAIAEGEIQLQLK